MGHQRKLHGRAALKETVLAPGNGINGDQGKKTQKTHQRMAGGENMDHMREERVVRRQLGEVE